MKLVKTIIFSLVPLLIILLAIELVGRAVYFQKKCPFPSMTHLVIHKVQLTYLRHVAKVKVRMQGRRDNFGDFFWKEEGRLVREAFMRQYTKYFHQFVEEVDSSGAKLMVVYMPADDYEKRSSIIDDVRGFYRNLAQVKGIPFLDLTDVFRQYPVEWVTLLPENGHLSRLGNQIAAGQIKDFIDEHFGAYKTTKAFAQRPSLLGDLTPWQRSICDIAPQMPYMLVTNRQGLRMEHELVFPKTKQRILMIGDSFTYGPNLHNHDTLSGLLTKLDTSREFVNAGVAGFTISDELSLFQERAKYTQPDVVVLQVLENDLTDFFSFTRNEFDRQHRRHEPSPEEELFLKEP